jgi:hypothetical protein
MHNNELIEKCLEAWEHKGEVKGPFQGGENN